MASLDQSMNTKSLFPPKDPNKSYGWFGYEGAMCDRAIRADNPEMLTEAVKHGWINANSEMLDGKSILQHCERVAPRCAEALRKLLPLKPPPIPPRTAERGKSPET